MRRRVIEWTIFAAVAVGTVLLVLWLVPRAVLLIYRTVAKPAPMRIDPALRRELRQAESKLRARRTVVARAKPDGEPCLVIPAPLGVVTPAGDRPKSPIRNCLELIPGGPPLNLVEVDLRTDTLLLVQTDLYLPGDPPIALTRVVEPLRGWNRRFGIFMQDEYDTFPFGDRFPYTYQEVVLADRSEILLRRISKGTGYADAIYENEARGSIFCRALEGWNGDGWDLDLSDGETLVFPEAYSSRRPPQGALVGLIAPSGSSLTFKRDSNGNLQSVRASDGRWMRIVYQRRLVVALEDSAGEKASFSYRRDNLLASSTNTEGESLSYDYNEHGEPLELRNTATGKTVFKADYGGMGAITSLRVAGGRTFGFSYRIDPTGSYAVVGISEAGVGRWSVPLHNCTASGCAYEVVSR